MRRLAFGPIVAAGFYLCACGGAASTARRGAAEMDDQTAGAALDAGAREDETAKAAAGESAASAKTAAREGSPAENSPAEPAPPASRWEESIRAFEAEDRESPPPDGAILFVGSSSIRLWNTARDFADLATINRGFGGSEMSDVVEYLDRVVLPYAPKTIVLYEGDNDIANGKSAERVLRDYRAFVAGVHAALPHTRILFIAIKPSLARWKLVETMRAANRLVRAEAAKDPRLGYLDIDTPMLGADGKPRAELFVEDGLHLSEAGYTIWSEVVRRALEGAPASSS